MFAKGIKKLGWVMIPLLVAACSPKEEAPAAPAAPETAQEETAAPTPEPAPEEPKGPCLVKAGASEYQIVVAESASASEKQGAKELQAYIKDCTGAELPIVADNPSNVPMIVVGWHPFTRILGVVPPDENIGEQGYVLKTVEPHIVIAGSPAAGTLYGVYDFLERVLGVRWFAPGTTKKPEADTIALPQLDDVVTPAFTMRDTSYTRPGADREFLAHMRENAGGDGPDARYGMQEAHDSRCHTYFRFISPGEFFDEHPEYFSEIGGVRQRDESQLCLTNPDVLEIVTERMLKRMEENPGAQQHNFSQMDWYNYCECAKCTAMNEQYGTPGATQFWFVNQLAERTSKKYPDKLIGTLAYMYTEEVPKGMKMHPNVAVWLCHMFPSCDSHPIRTCEFNADYKRRALGWADACEHVYIWHYIVDFAHYYNPFPNFRAMTDDMRFYQEIGVQGVYLQGMSHGGGGGEFSLLRPYLGMKLLWNPQVDADAVIDDFLAGYYGDAAEPIREYIDLLHDKVTDENIHMHLYTNPGQGYLTDEVMAKAHALFDEAEAAVQDDARLLERVRVARMPLVYAGWFPRSGYRIENGQLIFNGEFVQMPETEAFLARMEKHGFTTIREWGGDPEQLRMYTMAVNTPLPLSTIKNEHLTVDVLPFTGARALRIIDNKTGKCATAYNTVRSLYFPHAGGEETRVGGTTFMTSPGGNMDMFKVVEHTEKSVACEAKIGPFMLRRTMTLAGDAPVLTVTNTLTNASDKPREGKVHSHLELDLSEKVADTKVSFVNRKGEKVEKDMRPIIAGLREGEHYYDQNAPKGEWTFTGTDGLQVRQSFDDAAVDFTWLYAYPEYLNDLEVEVFSLPRQLAPGESMEFSINLEVTAVAE